MYERIRATHQPNFSKAKCSVASGLNIAAWEQALKGYHDYELCEYLKYGWPLGYHKQAPPRSIEENHTSAQQHLHHVRSFIQKELSFGALLGPFSAPPFDPWTRCSPVHGCSYTLPSIGDLVIKLQQHGPGALVWKADLARAYRQLRVDPLTTPLLGMKVDGKYYVDLCPPFGCRTSSAACQRVSNALTYLMGKKQYFTLAYLDDYAGCEACIGPAQNSYDTFTALAGQLGLELATQKCVPPTSDIEWLGYRIGTKEMTVSLPDSKLQEILIECEAWLRRSRANKKMVQSLAGKLLYITNCITPARKFMFRILATLRGMAERNWATINKEFKLDLQWFLNYAKAENGVLYYNPQKKEIEVQCDSSLTGGGGIAGGYCYAWRYPRSHTQRYPLIHHLEAINLLVAFRTLASLVREAGACIVMETDNMGSSWALQSGKTKDSVFANCARELWLEALTTGLTVNIRHKHGTLIPMADALSRQHDDPAKLAYVRDRIRRDHICSVLPKLNDYVFFNNQI